MNRKIKAGIVGAAGYTGGELIRLLLQHPDAELIFAHSNSQAGKPLWLVHTDLLGDTDLLFTDQLNADVDILFLCVAHGEAKTFLAKNKLAEGTKLIDLSQDYRLKGAANDFVYGLPELNRERIRTSDHVANPGCFATAIQLALLPLASNGLLNDDLHISATTGSTGAGQSLSATSHFSWRSGNSSAYKVLEHQHLGEIQQSLAQLQPAFAQAVQFVPYRGAFTRGILAGVYTSCNIGFAEIKKLYADYYATHPFVHLSEQAIDLKQVVNTNKCLLQLEQHGDQLFITSIIDNLLKGASGQAVQNMNLLFGLEETAGLKLKAVAF